MRKRWKILGRIVGVFAALVLVLVIGLRLFLPAEKLRDLAVARASTALGREVTVGGAGVSLRGGLGIRLTDVSIGNPAGFPDGQLLTAQSVDLMLQLRPLLHRRIHADRLVIHAPVVTLVRLDAERNNFTFAAPAAGAEAGGSAAGNDAAAFDLERFECDDGRLDFRDDAAGTGFALSGLRLSWTVRAADAGRLVTDGETHADSLLLRGAQPFATGPADLVHTARLETTDQRFVLEHGALILAGLAFDVTAEADYDPAAPTARAEIAGAALNVAELLALVPAEHRAVLEGVEAEGLLALRTIVSFDPARAAPLDVQGSLELTGGRLALPDFPEPVTGLAASLAFGLDTLTVRSCSARTVGADLSFAGRVTGLQQPKDLRIDGTVDVKSDLAALQRFLPAERAAILTGRATGSVQLAGRLDAPQSLLTGGRLAVTDLAYRDAHLFEPVTDLDAEVVLGSRDATIRKLAVRFAPSSCSLTGVVRGLVPALLDSTAARPRLEFTLDAPLFNVDHLFPAASPGATPLGAAAEAGRTAVIPDFPDFTGTGRATIQRLIYGGVSFTGITGRIDIADRIVTVSEANGAVFAGRVVGETSIDLKDMKNPVYGGRFAATAIQADSLMSRFTPLRGHVQGALDFSGTYTAAGKDPVAFRRSLTLDSRGALSQGRLVTSGVIRQGLTALASKLGRPFDGEERLKELAGTVKVDGERVIFDGFTSQVTGLGALSLAGSYGFTGDLDFRGDLLLTEEHSRKLLAAPSGALGGVLGNLLGRPGQPTSRLSLPVRIGGAFTRPDVAVDFSAVAKASGQGAADALKGKLEGLFRK